MTGRKPKRSILQRFLADEAAGGIVLMAAAALAMIAANSPLADACQVPLTSTTAEMRECGRIAVGMLRKKTHGQTVKSAVVQPRLVIRASSK